MLKLRFLSRFKLVFYKGSNWHNTSILDYRVRIRRSALGVCLSDSSMHHSNVHRTWPLSRMGVIRRRCPTQHTANIAVSEFLSVLTSCCPSHVAVRIFETGSKAPPPRPACKFSSSWLVLAHHPVWEKGGLSSKLHSIFLKWLPQLEEAEEDVSDLRCRIAWSLGGIPLVSRIKRCNVGR